jgi:hypothetical protein
MSCRIRYRVTRPPTKREGKNVNIPALVLNPGNDGIAGIAFSIPE